MSKLNSEEFRLLVFEVAKLIPEGRATSYGAIAKAIGHPNLSRMVGRMMAGCSALDVPAHRVVNSQGILSGKDAFETPSTMQKRLEEEGIVVLNNRIRNWKHVFWNPLEELDVEERGM